MINDKFPKKKCEEQLLFPKEKWDSLIKWRPISNIPVEEIYENLPEVKEFHDSFCRLWLREKSR